MGPGGQVLIPTAIRRAAGMEPGSIVVVSLEGDQVVLLTREAIKRRLHDMFSDVEGSMAEELIAERRDEASASTS